MPKNRWGLPDLGVGIGLRTKHFRHILAHWPEVDFFEILSENFLQTGGRPMQVLDRVCERYPVVLHGVSMSIGSTDPLDRDYLAQLKRLAERTRARWVSDHLCWTGVSGHNTHDLLPMPLTEEALRHTAMRVRQASEILERPLFLENPSTYLAFSTSTMTEWDFLVRLCEESGAGLLLDVNNIYVSSFNHDYDPRSYLEAIPPELVVQVHLAGHTHKGTHILDTHSDHAVDAVWDLYRATVERTGPVATLYEWDEDIPSFDVVWREALKARRFRPASAGRPVPALASAGRSR